MDYSFYAGKGVRSGEPSKLHAQLSRAAIAPEPASYHADTGLAAAANVALLLGQPLLLTGEPGVGKTEFAYSLAWELGFNEPLKFETKSTTSARDLFYTYDALKRFHDAHTGGQEVLNYITFNALGLAILRTCASGGVPDVLKNQVAACEPVRSVVLIDEVDKAPRDFSNDLLNELEHMYFRIPELNNLQVTADKNMRPVVVITSNSERDLPDAFLRRCVYYNIPFPDRDRLVEIVVKRLGTKLPQAAGIRPEVVAQYSDLFLELRGTSSGLRKKPATAEFLGWLSAMVAVCGGDAWWRRTPRAAAPAQVYVAPGETSFESKITSIERRSRVWRYGLVLLAAASLVGLAVVLADRTPSTTEPASPGPAVAGAPAVADAPVALPSDRVDVKPAVLAPTIVRDPIVEPPTTTTGAFPWWIAVVLLAATPLVCWWLWRQWWALKARSFLVRQATTTRPEVQDFVVRTIEDELFPGSEIFGVARALRQRRSVPSAELHIERTIARTTEAAGFFHPVFADRQVTPEYLALIDRRSPGDQLARLYDKCLDRLEQQGVFVRRFYFGGDPRVLFGRELAPVPIALRKVSRRYAEHRLLVFSDGQTFFDSVTGQPAAWSDLFNAWSQRAWLMTEPAWSLGAAAHLLEERFLVEQANLTGLARVVARFAAPGGVLAGPSPEQPLPIPNDLLVRPGRWLERLEPSEQLVDKMLGGLRPMLGNAGPFGSNEPGSDFLFIATSVYSESPSSGESKRPGSPSNSRWDELPSDPSSFGGVRWKTAR